MEFDFSKSDECVGWLNYRYIVLGRSLYGFLSGAEKYKDNILQTEECTHHYKDIIDRLQVLYRMVAGLDLVKKPVLDLNLSLDELFKKNWMEIMTINDPVEIFDKPILTENQDFRPLGFPYPFSAWFHEKTSSLAESFVYVSSWLYDNCFEVFNTEWVNYVNSSAIELRELLDFLNHTPFKINEKLLPSVSLEEFFIFHGFKKEISRYNPSSDYWREEKAKKGVKKFLEKWNKLIQIPLDKGGRTLLYDAFEHLGIRDIRIGELRNELDCVSMGEKKWVEFLEESQETIKKLQERPYDHYYYGFMSFKEREEVLKGEERRRLFEENC